MYKSVNLVIIGSGNALSRFAKPLPKPSLTYYQLNLILLYVHIIVASDWTLRNTLKTKTESKYDFCQKWFEHSVCQMAAILPRSRSVNAMVCRGFTGKAKAPVCIGRISHKWPFDSLCHHSIWHVLIVWIFDDDSVIRHLSQYRKSSEIDLQKHFFRP